MDNKSSKSTLSAYAPASLWRRAAAMAYDSLIIFSFLILATAIALIVNQGRSFLSVQYYFLFYLILSTGLFLSWFWHRSGQTLGMLAWKVKIVTQEGQLLSWPKALARYFIALISISCGIAWLWFLFNKEKKSFYDWATGTRVIHLKPLKSSRLF